MSNFLNQFNNQNYKSSQAETSKKTSDQSGSEIKSSNLNTHGSQLHNSDNDGAVHTSKIKNPEHITEIDTSYNKRKIIRYSIIGGTIIVVCSTLFLIFWLMNQVTVKDFVGTGINDAKTWGLTNSISIESTEEYSLKYDQNTIILQNKEPGSKIQKGSVLNFVVSKGPDPNEHIQLPDFSTMTASEVQEWKEEYKAINVNIVQEYSDTLEKGIFIRKEFTNSIISEDNYIRNDGLLIYISKGPEIYEKDIAVSDFAGKTKEEVAEWVKKNEIEATYAEEASDTVGKDSVISQDIAAGTKIAKKTAMTFVISLGKSVTIPNFNTMTKEDATTYSGISVIVKTQYSASVAYGKVISQSVEAGTQLLGESPEVTVVYSEGRPYIENLIGKTEYDLQSYFYDFNSRGATITYAIAYVDSSEDKGLVVWASRYGEFVSLNSHIDIHVSKGNLAKESVTNFD